MGFSPPSMPPIFTLFISLTIVGVLSPLLTFTALFQQKEWRFDRFLEHLRHEGFIKQVWGTIRPLLAILLFCIDLLGLFLVIQATTEDEAVLFIAPFFLAHFLLLSIFAALTVLQIAFRKQRMPVWTGKAGLIFGISFILSILSIVVTVSYLVFAPVILLIQPLCVLLAWALLLPLDHHLKNTWYSRAHAARKTWTGATVIGIAGSVGKTTTKELLNHLLTDLSPITTPQHINSEMGVAQWMVSEDATIKKQGSPVIIVEMGAYKKGEIALMCSFVEPTIGVITALGSDHVALFGSEEAIIDANVELAESLPEDGHAFLYADNDATFSLKNRIHCLQTSAGLRADASVHPDVAKETDMGLSVTMQKQVSIVALHGMHNVGNIMLAVAVAKHLGVTDKRIHELLESFKPLLHTFDVRTEKGITLVDDTYNSSRLSILAALQWAKDRKDRPRILLMSGLLETGKDEERFMEELGMAAAGSIEHVIFLSRKGKKFFERGYNAPVEILSRRSIRVPADGLLLCLGRMPLSTVQKLLPLS